MQIVFFKILLGVLILSVSTALRLDFLTVLMVFVFLIL